MGYHFPLKILKISNIIYLTGLLEERKQKGGGRTSSIQGLISIKCLEYPVDTEDQITNEPDYIKSAGSLMLLLQRNLSRPFIKEKPSINKANYI